MDPIHPIVPVFPNIPPITPAPMIGRIDRDAPRDGPDQDKRRRRPPDPSPLASDERDGDEDSGLHINVTA
jgi:hypothetical protein